MTMRITISLLASTAILSLTTAPVAQETDQAANEGEQARALDMIVVTATRRAESLQDVGLSISAIGEAEIEARGINDFFDYGSTIPNLSFGAVGDGALNNRSVSIRGIQGSGTTGFYIDDTPVEESIDPRILDVERIEILRGPQGTLYGARSMGGTVRLITKQPDAAEMLGRVRARLSGTEEGGANYFVDGALNLPLVEDSLGLRILGFYQHEEGVFDRAFGGITSGEGYPGDVPPATGENRNVDDETAYGGQIALRWAPSDRLDITPRLLYQRVELDGFPFADNDPGNFTQRAIFDTPERGRDEFILSTLTAKYELDIGELVWVSSYFDRETFEFEDFSPFVLAFAGTDLFTGIPGGFGLADPIEARIFRELGLESRTQEVRFVSGFERRLQLTLGGFHSERDAVEDFVPPANAPGLDAATPVVPFGTDTVFTSMTRESVEELAVFGEASFAVTESFRALLGVRVFNNEIDFRDTQFGIVVGPEEAAVEGTQSESGETLKIGVEWEPNADVLVYATAAEGFRIGGVNGTVPVATCADDLAAAGLTPESTTAFESDGLWNYEVGAKSRWLAGRLTVNAAVFFIDWKDIQQTQLLQCGFSFVTNAGAAQSVGGDLELAARFGNGFGFDFNLGYNDAEITEGGEGLSFSAGDPVQQVPEWTLSANAAYDFEITEHLDGYLRSDLAYVGESFSATNDAANPRLRDAYAIVNLRLGMRRDDIEIAFFADNVTNEIANLSDNRSLAAEIPGRRRLVVNRPRTIGIEMRKLF